MITGIVRKQHPFVLEADRTNPPDQQTVFWIVPKTVRGATETAANYAKVQIEKRRKGTKEIDVKAMQLADMDEWLKAVERVQNFACPEGAPGLNDEDSAFDHFVLRAEKDPSKYVVKGDNIIIVDTTDEMDRKYIMCAMCPAEQEEVMNAYFDYSALKEGLKNG